MEMSVGEDEQEEQGSRREVLDTRPAKDRAKELTLLTPANEHPAKTHGELSEPNA